LWEDTEKLSLEDRLNLELSITLEEVKLTIFYSNGNKVPGPNGILFTFYQQYWVLASQDTFCIVQACYNNQFN
jgi:hypothetical protein